MASIKLEIVTPTGRVLEADAASVTLPGVVGELTVLPEHRAALIMLGGGPIRISGAGADQTVYVRGGVAEVGPAKVLVLADAALRPEQTDRREAENILHEVEGRLKTHAYLDDGTLLDAEIDRRYAESILRAQGH